MAKKNAGPKKYTPLRTCVICREKTDKRQLTRIVRSAEGDVFVDLTGKKNGRGAYICSKINCWDAVVQTKKLDQALKATLTEEQRAAIWSHKPNTA